VEEQFCHLTTTGRRTGRPHVVEMWFARWHDTLYLLAGAREGADWVRNVSASPAVRVGLGAEERHARARVVAPGTEEDALARRLLLEKYQMAGTRHLEGWGATALAVAIELQDGR